MQIPNPHPRRVPTDEELKHCFSVVEDTDRQIAQIKEGIEDLQMQLKTLTATRMNLLSFISPIKRLPPELIGEICETCVKAGISPLVLGQVCGRLREIVNGTSELWSHIHVTDGSRWSDYWGGEEYWEATKVNPYHYCLE
jgi:hypothetical protein